MYIYITLVYCNLYCIYLSFNLSCIPFFIHICRKQLQNLLPLTAASQMSLDRWAEVIALQFEEAVQMTSTTTRTKYLGMDTMHSHKTNHNIYTV